MFLCLGLTPALQRTMLFNGFTPGSVNRAVETHESAAGKSVNVTRVLRAMGGEAMAIGFVGGDRGDLLMHYLDLAGVAHDFVRVEARTRLCTTLIDRGSAQVTELVEESAAVETRAIDEVIGKVRQHLPQARMVILSGSLTPAAPADFYRICVGLAHERGVPVILDAQGPPLMHAIPARPTLVKPNRSELAATLGMRIDFEDDLKQAMMRLVDRGAQRVVVTMGADGAVATDGSSFWRVIVPSLTALNPIGSGDAFTAGLALALSDNRPLDESLRLGAACACANATTLLAGAVEQADVRGMLARIDVKP